MRLLTKFKIWLRFRNDEWFHCLYCDKITITPEDVQDYDEEMDWHPSLHAGVDHPLCTPHWWLTNLRDDIKEKYYNRATTLERLAELGYSESDIEKELEAIQNNH